MQRVRSFLAELRRRRVLQTAIWYIGGCVSVLGATSQIVIPAFGMPPQLLRPLTIIAIFGLPVALVLSWEFDVYSTATASNDPARKWRSLLPVAGMIVVSLLGAWFLLARDTGNGTAPDAADPSRIAVLPFTTNTTDADVVSFAVSLQVRLIEGLNIAAEINSDRESRLHVVSPALVESYVREGRKLDEIRRALNVGTALEGSVELAGDAVRVHIRLTDTKSGDLIAVRTAEKSGRDRVALLNAVSDSVVRLIRHELGGLLRDRAIHVETKDGEALARYEAGMQRLRDIDTNGMQKDSAAARAVFDGADVFLQQAEKLDPSWIEPTLARGELERTRYLNRGGFLAADADSVLNVALQHANRALKRHPGDYRALELRGRIELLALQEKNNATPVERRKLAANAENDLRLSLARSANPARALRALSELASTMGRMEEALEYGRQAYDKDPYLEDVGPTLLRLFQYSLALERDSMAEHFCSEGRVRYVHAIFDDCRLVLAAWSARYPLAPDSAFRIAQHELQIYGGPATPPFQGRVEALYAATLARNRLPDSANRVMHRALARDPATIYPIAAGVYSLLGKQDSAVLMIRKLLALKPDQRGVLETKPEMRLIRSNGDFVKLVRFRD